MRDGSQAAVGQADEGPRALCRQRRVSGGGDQVAAELDESASGGALNPRDDARVDHPGDFGREEGAFGLGLGRGVERNERAAGLRGRFVALAEHAEDEQAIGHPRICGKCRLVGLRPRDGDRDERGRAANQRTARPLPRVAAQRAERQHQCNGFASPDFPKREVEEIGGDARIAGGQRWTAAQLAEACRHFLLDVAGNVEGGGSRVALPDLDAFLPDPADKGRIHDDQVKGAMGDSLGELLDGLWEVAAGGFSLFQIREEILVDLGGKQIEGAVMDGAVVAAVTGGEDALALEGGGGMAGGEVGRGEMHRALEHVDPEEAVLHHRRVERFGVAAVHFVEQRDALIGSGKQSPRAAGEVADLHGCEGVRIAPIGVAGGAGAGQGEPGEQCRGGRARVEGGEELAVGDQALEDDPGQVVRMGHSSGDEPLD